MMQFRLFMILMLVLSILPACSNRGRDTKVIIEKTDKGFRMIYGGEPYFIKGARTIGTEYMDKVAAMGGNSVRIGSGGNMEAKLDTANKYRLSVLFGLPMSSQRNGFNYDDTAAVQKQFNEIKAIVNTYKNHPAILMWAIGNELDYVPDNPDYNQKLWDAVNDVAKMIHELDPNHPAITVIGTGRKYKMEHIKERLPDIDALGINSYGDIYDIPEWVQQYELNKPYLITEWGPTGHWQVPQNKWGLPIEETTTEKARAYYKRHEEVINADPSCLGGYSFLWTQGRQERTHTWYNMFFDGGEETEAVEVMQYVWTGEWPENRAPEIRSVQLNNFSKEENILIKQNKISQASVHAVDPNQDGLTFEWEIYPENTEFGYAGHGEKRPPSRNDLFISRYEAEIKFKGPAESGNYRIFVYVRDGRGKIATANIPFHVE